MNNELQRANAHPLRKLAWAVPTVLSAQMLTCLAMAQPAEPQTMAPLINEQVPNRIPGQYIVVFKSGVSREALAAMHERVRSLGGKIGHVYTSAISGFSATLPDSAVKALRTMPEVAYIEVDQVGVLDTVQVGPPAGLDRSSERFLPLDSRYTYSETGAGVHAYVIDTGIRPSHTEFGGRVSGGTNTMNAAAGTDDCHGHGTHVAGTIGGATFGIAKQVALHPVRAGDCANTYLAPVIAAVDWVTANSTHPAVANLSSQFSASPTLDTAITNSVASGVTYAVAAGNWSTDACTVSPARVPAAITVGAVDPANDTRAGFSDFGTCVDLFAPGVNTLSAGITSDTATAVMSGTSMASPHVAGVAARYLQTHGAATPAAVWAAIHNANNVATTVPWTGIVNPGAGSPNELLHYGSLNDGFNDGDPHIVTINGIHYDFQNGGEFVALRDSNMEIQTRQTPVPSAPWVSLNTAVATRVGGKRVTWQPNLSGVPDPSGLQLRIDGVLTSLGASSIDLGSGGRVSKHGSNAIQIDFPNDTSLIATSQWWAAQSRWYLDVHVFHTPATEGIMGAITPNAWAKASFADSWRVTDRTSLFDYAPRTSTVTFTKPAFPAVDIPPMKPENVALARTVCRPIVDKHLQQHCLFDVGTTGDAIFARSSLVSQKVRRGATMTTLGMDRRPGKTTEVTFIANVTPQARAANVRNGSVLFLLDGKQVGKPVPIDANGRAQWATYSRAVTNRNVVARYVPAKASAFLPSTSAELRYESERLQASDPLLDPIYRRQAAKAGSN